MPWWRFRFSFRTACSAMAARLSAFSVSELHIQRGPRKLKVSRICYAGPTDRVYSRDVLAQPVHYRLDWGLVTLGGTVLPSARKVLGVGPQTKEVMDTIQRRLSVLVYISIVVLVLTGLLMTRRSPVFQRFLPSTTPTQLCWPSSTSCSWL